MRIRTTLVVLTIALAVGTAFAAGLKERPPNGVKLSGSWKLDPNRSDDPALVIERAAQLEQEQRYREIEDQRRERDRSWDDGGSDDTWGGRVPNSRMPGDARNRRDPFPNGGGIDPTGRESSVRWSTGGGGGVRSDFLMLQLDPNPSTLTILDSGSRVSVSEDKLETACAGGETAPISDALGDGERRCGWTGRAWVIETKRTKRFKRTDRFELSKDGKVLLYTSTASSQQTPAIKVSRTYTLMPPAESK